MATATLEKPQGTAIEKVLDHGGKYLTFKLASEEYGVEILKVREINGVMNITAVPQMPPYVKGVINLRGSVIPIVDLRLKFGLEEIEYSEQTCIIVVDVGREIGIIVDTVSEVLDITGENIEPPPFLGGSAGASCILGMGKVGSAVKILLDIENVLADEGLTEIPDVPSGDDPAPVTDRAAKRDVLPTF